MLKIIVLVIVLRICVGDQSKTNPLIKNPIVDWENSKQETQDGGQKIGRSRRTSGYLHASATKGQPLPMPQYFKQFKKKPTLVILPLKFEINITGSKCDILSHAVERYKHLILLGESAGGRKFPNPNILDRIVKDAPSENSQKAKQQTKSCQQDARAVALSRLLIDVASPCVGHIYPQETSNEDYSLKVDESGAVVKAAEVWGALRGLETFSQLVFTNTTTNCLQLAQTKIKDFPRFKYRGLMLDTGRHFLPKEILLRNLDAMSYSKLNVFHWHIVDEESFPYQSRTYPNLSAKGAYDPITHVYTQADVKEIVEAARLRGIRVIPEFDTPGHTYNSWRGLPHFLTPCYRKTKKGEAFRPPRGVRPNGYFGSVDPSKNLTYEYLQNLVKEWKDVFPDKVIHLGGSSKPKNGGDEKAGLGFRCWESNPDIQAFMKKMGIASFNDLENYYFQRLLHIVQDQDRRSMVWQDLFDHNVKLKKNVVVQVWEEKSGPATMKKVTKKGLKAVYSGCWRFHLQGVLHYWTTKGSFVHEYYQCDPEEMATSPELVLGGEACVWGQFVESSQVLSQTWPAASVVAERLWSSKNEKNTNEMMNRLAEMECRFLHRGVPAGAMAGPGYCDKEWSSA